MNKNYSIIAVLLVLAGLVVIADTTETGILSSSTVIAQTTSMYQHDDVYNLTRGEDVEGSLAKITRTEAGLGIYMTTKNLPAGAYTAWLLIHNNPEECDGDCSLADIDPGTPAVHPGAIRIGHDYISNSNGEMTLSAWVPTADFVGDADSRLLPGSMFGGLENPMSAEVHVILKWHGVALNNQQSGVKGKGINPKAINHNLLDAQLHDIQGGCKEHQDLGDMNPAPITVGNGTFELCPDPQGATFTSPF